MSILRKELSKLNCPSKLLLIFPLMGLNCRGAENSHLPLTSLVMFSTAEKISPKYSNRMISTSCDQV